MNAANQHQLQNTRLTSTTVTSHAGVRYTTKFALREPTSTPLQKQTAFSTKLFKNKIVGVQFNIWKHVCFVYKLYRRCCCTQLFAEPGGTTQSDFAEEPSAHHFLSAHNWCWLPGTPITSISYIVAYKIKICLKNSEPAPPSAANFSPLEAFCLYFILCSMYLSISAIFTSLHFSPSVYPHPPLTAGCHKLMK